MKKIITIIGFIMVSALNTAFAGYFENSPAPHCDLVITQTLQIGD